MYTITSDKIASDTRDMVTELKAKIKSILESPAVFCAQSKLDLAICKNQLSEYEYQLEMYDRKSETHDEYDVKWKTVACSDPSCWCKMVVPATAYANSYTDDMIIIGSGCIEAELAEYIVELHNSHIDDMAYKKTWNNIDTSHP